MILTILNNFNFKEITQNNAKKCIKKLDLFINAIQLFFLPFPLF
jgi:hypothetical protein